MKEKKIVFFGTPQFACAVLEALIEEAFNVVAVVSQPDRPVGRKRIIEPTPVHALADAHAIPVLQPNKLKEALEEIQSYQPDLIVTCAYGQFIPESILKIPTLGCVNIHPSLLPKYRGGAPVHHAILNGDTETGVCLMEMVKEMDAGKVYTVHHCPIDENDTTASLNIKLMDISKQIIKEDLIRYMNGELPGEAQDESKVVIARNISPEEEKISFAQEDVNQVYNHIRALYDWPIAYGFIEGKRIKFFQASKEVKDHSYQRGEVVGFENGQMVIACAGGLIYINELQPEGKGKMMAKDYANGAGKGTIGKVFE